MLITGTLSDHAGDLAARIVRPEHPSVPHLAAPAAALGVPVLAGCTTSSGPGRASSPSSAPASAPPVWVARSGKLLAQITAS